MLAILLGLIISVVHFFSESIHVASEDHKMKVISFSSGIFVAYLFLHLFPLLYSETRMEISMMSVLIGFTFFHVIEKYIYRHERRPVVLKKEMKEIHSIAFFLYHLMIGVILVKMVNGSFTSTILFFVPILFISAISSISMKSLYVVRDRQARLILSFSTFIGTVVAFLITMPNVVYISIFGFMIGTLMYTILMDAIPKEREGDPIFFVIGLMVYMIVIMMTWFI